MKKQLLKYSLLTLAVGGVLATHANQNRLPAASGASAVPAPGSGSMTASAPASAAHRTIGDLEIYDASVSTGGGILMMMVDLSASMGLGHNISAADNSVFHDYNLRNCDSRVMRTVMRTVYYKDDQGNPIKDDKGVLYTDDKGNPIKDDKGNPIRVMAPITYKVYGCNDYNGNLRIDRISRMKDALIPAITNAAQLTSGLSMGMGHYPIEGSNIAAQLSVPARPLTLEHRQRLAQYVASMRPVTATPTAAAYFEAAAYMFGTNTATIQGPRQELYIPFNVIQPMQSGRRTFTSNNICYYFNGRNTTLLQTGNNISITTDNQGRKWVDCRGTNKNDMGSSHPFSRFDLGDIQFSYVAGNVSGQTHYGHKRNTFLPKKDEIYTGFFASADETKTEDGTRYKSPIKVKDTIQEECSAPGIYFMTDGLPNGFNGSGGALLSNARNALVKNTLKGENLPFDSSIPALASLAADGKPGKDRLGRPLYVAHDWQYIMSLAKVLNSKDNPIKTPIKTATMGFGSIFTDAHGNMPTKHVKVKDEKGNLVDRTYPDCDRMPTVHAKYLCMWGSPEYKYGQGGFTATNTPEGFSESLLTFASTLKSTAIPPAPSGIIEVPEDTLTATQVQSYAFMSSILPLQDKGFAIWPGNLKKYDVQDGTLYGSGARVFTKGTDGDLFPSVLSKQAYDQWTKNQSGSANEIGTGGAYANLTNPSADAPQSRNVFVDSGNAVVKVGVNQDKKLIGFDKLTDYNAQDKANLVNFLGYPIETGGSAYSQGHEQQLSELQTRLDAMEPSTPPVMGATVHSRPLNISFGARLQNGNISSDAETRDDFVMYGSMDGALHFVNVKTGTEAGAFIPRVLVKNQGEALKQGAASLAAGGDVRQGLDAPWTAITKYEIAATQGDVEGGVRATEVHVYGGMRMGGVGLYGLKLTKTPWEDDITPSLAFFINEQSNGFERLGHTWSRPIHARIKTGTGVTDTKEVLLVSGGYDVRYENPLYAPTNQAPARGNALYMIDTKTGALIQSWQMGKTASGDSSGYAHMSHSVVAEPAVLDRDSDGNIDHIYFADLGGQVFRVDLAPNDGTATRNMVRILNAASANPVQGEVAPRFYDRPTISFYNKGSGGKYALINLASGDRSNPVFNKYRGISTLDRTRWAPNHLYGVIDADVTARDLYVRTQDQLTKDTNESHLISWDKSNRAHAQSRAYYIAQMKDGSKRGWRFPLTRFDGMEDINHVKSVGAGYALSNTYYASVYSPDMLYGSKDACATNILGGTERQLYCLPYGICADDEGKYTRGSQTGTAGYTPAGPGIQEAAFGPVNSSTSSGTSTARMMLGMVPIQEQLSKVHRTNQGDIYNPNTNASLTNASGTRVDGSASPVLIELGYTMKTERWYDLDNAVASEGI